MRLLSLINKWFFRFGYVPESADEMWKDMLAACRREFEDYRGAVREEIKQLQDSLHKQQAEVRRQHELLLVREQEIRTLEQQFKDCEDEITTGNIKPKSDL